MPGISFFSPSLLALASAPVLVGVGNTISGFVQNFPTLSKGLALAAGGFMALSAAATVARLGAVLFRGGLLNIRAAAMGVTGGLARLDAAFTRHTVAAGTAAAGTTGFTAATGATTVATRTFGSALRGALISSGIGAVLVGLGLAAEYIYDNWSRIGPALADFFSPITDGISEAWGTITDVAAGVAQFFRSIGPVLYVYLKPHIDRVVSAFRSAVGWIGEKWQSLYTSISGVCSRISGAVSETWNSITTGLSATWDSIRNGAVAVWDDIGNFISGVADSVSETWNSVTETFSGIWDSISSGATNTWNGISSAASSVTTWIAETWYGLADWFVGVWDSISDPAAAAWNWIADSCSPVTDWLTETWSTISDALHSMWDGIAEAASACWEGISTAFAPAIEFFTGIVEGIRSVFTGLFDWLKAKFDWIISTASSVMDTVSGWFGGASESISAAAHDASDGVSTTMGDARTAAEQHREARIREKQATIASRQKAEAPRPKERAHIEKPAPALRGAPQFRPGAPVEPQQPKQKKGKSGGGSGKRSGAGGGGRASGSSTSGTSGTTIVKLAGDNRNFTTSYIPAGMSTGTARRISPAQGVSARPGTTSGRSTVSRTASDGVQKSGATQPQKKSGAMDILAARPIPVIVLNMPGAEKAARQADERLSRREEPMPVQVASAEPVQISMPRDAEVPLRIAGSVPREIEAPQITMQSAPAMPSIAPEEPRPPMDIRLPESPMKKFGAFPEKPVGGGLFPKLGLGSLDDVFSRTQGFLGGIAGTVRSFPKQVGAVTDGVTDHIRSFLPGSRTEAVLPAASVPPGGIPGRERRKSPGTAPADPGQYEVSINQTFQVGAGSDVDAIRKGINGLKPEIERLVRRVLDNVAVQQKRSVYAQ